MNKNKVEHLDGLRGVAAFIVVFAHYLDAYYPRMFHTTKPSHNMLERYLPQTPFNILFNGNFAVCLFFVLSGFVLSRAFFIKKDTTILHKSFVKRYFRLAFPALIAVFIPLIAFKCLVAGDAPNISYIKHSLPHFFTYDHWYDPLRRVLFDNFFDYKRYYIGPLWTLTYELIGSFLVFGILYVARHNAYLRYGLYAFVLIFIWDSYFLGFLLGLLISDVFHNHPTTMERLKRWWIVAPVLLIGLLFASYPYIIAKGSVYEFLTFDTHKPSFSYIFFYRLIGSALILFALLLSSFMQRLFSSKVAVFLGRHSFSLYLNHYLILYSLAPILFASISLHHTYNHAVIIVSFICVAITFIYAMLFTHFIDEPIVKKLTKLTNLIVKGKRIQ
jgi:peptidoglycan/LPS O-acetylase OafA/YrhL